MTNVLLLYDNFIPSVRLCAYEQLNYLHHQGKISLKHTSVNKITQAMCLECDVVFFVRSSSFLEMKLASEFKKKNKLLIYVLDDDLLNIADGLSSSNYFKKDVVKNRIYAIIDKCDILVTPSYVLKEKYKSYFYKTVIIEEPALMVGNFRVPQEKNYLTIGFAGSIDRTGDIELILSEVIKNLIDKYKEAVKFEFMGAKPKIVEELNLTYYGYEDDYDSYKEKLDSLEWDIGLAPLPDSEFHKCKYYNKYIEYGSASIVGVYSNVEPYTRIILHKKNGLMCDNSVQSWMEQIIWIIEHPTERREMISRIQSEMECRFNLQKSAEDFIDKIPELILYKTFNNKKFYLNLIKAKYICVKGIDFIKRYGIKSFIVAFKRIFT